MRMKDKVVVITGGGSGIGRATARLLAREGARLALVDRDADGVAAVAAEVAALGAEVVTRVADVGEPGAAEADAGAVLARFVRIDALFCAAGFSTGGTVETTRPEDWDAVFRANVGGSWLWARAVIPAMRAQGGGAILFTASQLALAGGSGNAAYVAAKGAIIALARTCAVDFAPDRIRVNAVAPGAVDTPMLRRSFARRADPAAAEAASVARHAMKRLGRPEEIAEAALYLLSDASSFVTGTTLPVEGGWLAS